LRSRLSSLVINFWQLQLNQHLFAFAAQFSFIDLRKIFIDSRYGEMKPSSIGSKGFA